VKSLEGALGQQPEVGIPSLKPGVRGVSVGVKLEDLVEEPVLPGARSEPMLREIGNQRVTPTTAFSVVDHRVEEI